MEVFTASSTVLPVPLVARSMAQARSKIEMDAGLFRGDEREHDHLHIAAGQKMRGKIVDAERQAGFHGGDAAVHDQAHRNPPQAQGNQFDDGDFGAGKEGADVDHPKVERDDDNHERHHGSHAQKHESPCACREVEAGLSKNQIHKLIPFFDPQSDHNPTMSRAAGSSGAMRSTLINTLFTNR